MADTHSHISLVTTRRREGEGGGRRGRRGKEEETDVSKLPY